MSPAANQRAAGGSQDYPDDAAKFIAEKGPIRRDGDDTLSALIRGIDDLERLGRWQREASKAGRTDVQARLTKRADELRGDTDGQTEVSEA